MATNKKARAEAATKLSRATRLAWIHRGINVIRRHGRRWTAATTPNQIIRAREQVATYNSARQAAL
jgi:hypothetical protein